MKHATYAKLSAEQCLALMQVLRAAVMAEDPAGRVHMREPNRSLLKPEMVWQYEKGFSQTPEEVCQQPSFDWCHNRVLAAVSLHVQHLSCHPPCLECSGKNVSSAAVQSIYQSTAISRTSAIEALLHVQLKLLQLLLSVHLRLLLGLGHP